MTKRTRHSDSARPPRTRKTCTTCGRRKPLSQFNRDARFSDGRRPSCKTCTRARGREYYRRNRRAIGARERRLYRARAAAIRAGELPTPDRKRCRKCGLTKPLSEFTPSASHPDGHQARCRACVREQQRAWRRRNRFAANAAVRAYHARNPEWSRRIRRRQAGKHRARMRAYSKRYYHTQRHKVDAHVHVKAAKLLGILEPAPCEICSFLGLPADVEESQGHHEDYDRPLYVRWLCPSHHGLLHAGHFRLLAQPEAEVPGKAPQARRGGA